MNYGTYMIHLFSELLDEMEVMTQAEMVQDNLDAIPVEELDRMAPAAAIRRHLLWDHLVRLQQD